MKKKLKKGSALALALVLTLSTVVMSKVQAAISIETDRQCSVKFELDAVYPELSGENMTIPVRMYKVADVNQYGEYQALAGFEAGFHQQQDNSTRMGRESQECSEGGRRKPDRGNSF